MTSWGEILDVRVRNDLHLVSQTIPGCPWRLLSLFWDFKHQQPPGFCLQPLLQSPEISVGDFRTPFDSFIYLLPVSGFQIFTGQSRLHCLHSGLLCVYAQSPCVQNELISRLTLPRSPPTLSPALDTSVNFTSCLCFTSFSRIRCTACQTYCITSLKSFSSFPSLSCPLTQHYLSQHCLLKTILCLHLLKRPSTLLLDKFLKMGFWSHPSLSQDVLMLPLIRSLVLAINLLHSLTPVFLSILISLWTFLPTAQIHLFALFPTALPILTKLLFMWPSAEKPHFSLPSIHPNPTCHISQWSPKWCVCTVWDVQDFPFAGRIRKFHFSLF